MIPVWVIVTGRRDSDRETQAWDWSWDLPTVPRVGDIIQFNTEDPAGDETLRARVTSVTWYEEFPLRNEEDSGQRWAIHVYGELVDEDAEDRRKFRRRSLLPRHRLRPR